MSDKINELLSLRASGHTKRWHTLQILGEQTVAAHSAQCLTLLFMLHPDPTMTLVKALLWHDSAERVVGDVPSPALRADPEYMRIYEESEMAFMQEHHPMAHTAIFRLTPEERRWLKAIDRLELVMFMSDQVMLGNKHAMVVLERALGYIRSDTNTPKEVLEFMITFEDEGPRSFA